MTNKTNTNGKQNMQHLLLYPNMVLKQINFTNFD